MLDVAESMLDAHRFFDGPLYTELQTWDMHDSATEHVLLLRLAPDDAPNAMVFTTTGCLGQLGMNAEGVCVGINNLTSVDGTLGVTWPTVVRAMLRSSTAEEALAILLGVNLAGAQTRDPTAICQLATPPYHVESSGGVIMRPSTGDFWACWGPPIDNDYQAFRMRHNTLEPSS